MQELIAHQETINRQLARYGVKFGIYKNGEFKERLFPFDPLPRVIPAAEFAVLDKGLCQRVMALNMFLEDLYGDKKIIRDGVVPEDLRRRKEFTAIFPASTWWKAGTAAGLCWRITCAYRQALRIP